jgi:lactoylglutathione lyase
VDHIGFSFHGLPAKVMALEAAGVKVTSPVRDVPGLFKLAFVEDPWGTRIELVEDHEYPGFHHVHLSTSDPTRTLDWYQNVFGGERTRMKGQLDSVLYGGKVWLLAMRAREAVAGTDGRVIDHLGFGFADLDAAAAEIKQKGITFDQEPRAIDGPTSSAKISFINGPDAVRIEVVEPRR